MLALTTPFVPEFTPILPTAYAHKRALYFDIETTGLSAQTSYVYLIGCAYEKEGNFLLSQWLCTDPSEEKELLRLFFAIANDYELLVHYNGTGFDLPFLEKKAKRHRLKNPLTSMATLDLYRIARKLNVYLATPDLKLKSTERFFGFTRTDCFSGKDLIEVYAQFLGLHRLNSMTSRTNAAKEEALTQVLLLHNAEDVKHLPSLTVLSFLQNLSAYLTPDHLLPLTDDILIHPDTKKKNASAPTFLSIPFRVSFSLPNACTLTLPFDEQRIFLTLACDGVITLTLPVYFGELKYFYQTPADYYYLPLEDCAMHKSIATFVDKAYRKKATAATCYTKKEGTFLPYTLRSCKTEQATDMTTPTVDSILPPEKKEASESFPCFLSDYKSSFCYTPLNKELLADKDQLTLLVKALLHALL